MIAIMGGKAASVDGDEVDDKTIHLESVALYIAEYLNDHDSKNY